MNDQSTPPSTMSQIPSTARSAVSDQKPGASADPISKAHSFIGIVCGLKSEARMVTKVWGCKPIRIGVSGAHAGRAEHIAAEFCALGARAILSIGVSGGLDPDLVPGDVVIGESIITHDNNQFECNAALAEQFSSNLPDAQMMKLFGSDDIIASTQEKEALFEKFGSKAVDMESHGAARAAHKAGVPFAAIRAIADPAARVLPPAALGAVAPDGSTRVVKTLLACAKAPSQFPALIKLGQESNTALSALGAALAKVSL